MEAGRKRDQISTRTAINGRLAIHEEDGAGNFPRGALPASANGRRDKRGDDGPKGQGQIALMAAGGFIPWLVARPQVRITVTIMSIGRWTRQTKRHPVMENCALARGMFRRISGHIRCPRIGGGWKRATIIGANGVEGQTRNNKQDRQSALYRNH
jgi:hypothetical protein